MAWASKEEEALHHIGQHMGVMEVEKRRELSNLYTRLIFPQQNHTWSEIKWTSLWGVTFITMWDEEHLLKNIRFAMLQEQMRMGPGNYCILANWMPNFESRLLLLIKYLPHKKMSFFPPQLALGGPFLHSPWREIGDEISMRRLRLKSPLVRTLYYSQQFQIFIRTGIYGEII